VKTRLVVISAIRLYREGLAEALDRHEGFEVVATATTAYDVSDDLLRLEPDVVLLDASAVGTDHARAILGEAPRIKVVALALSETADDVIPWAKAGAAGFVTREASLEELIDTVAGVMQGQSVASPQLTAALLERVATLVSEDRPTTVEARLTSREREILMLIDAGLSNKQIARRLMIEVATVKNHVHNILEKLHVRRRADAAARMREHSP
jgi:two-component system nitrate/nitrite response regulator NarL